MMTLSITNWQAGRPVKKVLGKRRMAVDNNKPRRGRKEALRIILQERERKYFIYCKQGFASERSTTSSLEKRKEWPWFVGTAGLCMFLFLHWLVSTHFTQSQKKWLLWAVGAGPSTHRWQGPRGCLEGVVRMRAFGGDTPPPLSTQHGLSLVIWQFWILPRTPKQKAGDLDALCGSETHVPLDQGTTEQTPQESPLCAGEAVFPRNHYIP